LSNISQLANVPDISFIENMSLEETEQQVIDTYLRLYQNLRERKQSWEMRTQRSFS